MPTGIYPRTVQHRKKIGDSLRGRKRPKQSAIMKRNTYAKGNIGNRQTPEWIRKRVASLAGNNHYGDFRANGPKDVAKWLKKRVVTLSKYGLTLKSYQAMKVAQNGKCRICLKTTRYFHIDHDHITGRVRGLLCARCNIALGLFRDNPRILRNAIKYLAAV
jgi:Recombination endonuclease VII